MEYSANSAQKIQPHRKSLIAMGDLWRSQEMQLIQLYIQMEAANETVDELGKLGLIQFRDVRRFTSNSIFH